MQEPQEMQIQSLGREDPPEKEMAIPSTILAWEIPWTMESGGLQSVELQRVGHNWATNTNTLNENESTIQYTGLQIIY